MKKSIVALTVILFSVFFTAIFYKQMVGLNLFLFNIAVLSALIWGYKAFDFKNKTHLAVVGGTLLTAIGVLWHASALVITINILSLVALFGIVNNRETRLLVNTAMSAICQFFSAPFLFFRRDKEAPKRTNKTKRILRWIGLTLIPLITLIVFFILYSASSSKFYSIFGFIGEAIADALEYFFEHLNFALIFLFLFGFVIACAYFVKTHSVTAFEERKTDSLARRKNYKYRGATLGLLSEYRIGIIMFALLNVLLAVFNAIDVWHVWFHFEWDGELLKEFVHQGTYVLIFTLIISVGLVLIFFRKNLNFYSKNKPLKILANIWLAQNMIMAISVLIRNLHYINYYNLAYLRIGVLLFLAMTFFGLVTVYIKVNKTRNFFYLFRVNMLFAYLSLMVFSLANWDVIIAKYNFSRADKAFVPLDFMARLSDKALPYLDKSAEEVEGIEENPVFMKLGKREYFMAPATYVERIESKKAYFLKEYPQRSLLEWNYADWRAYKKVSDGQKQ